MSGIGLFGKLLLVSTQVGRKAQESHVQLGLSGSSPQIYRAEAILANGTSIAAVYADHVDLERDSHQAIASLRRLTEGPAPDLVFSRF